MPRFEVRRHGGVDVTTIIAPSLELAVSMVKQGDVDNWQVEYYDHGPGMSGAELKARVPFGVGNRYVHIAPAKRSVVR